MANSDNKNKIKRGEGVKYGFPKKEKVYIQYNNLTTFNF